MSYVSKKQEIGNDIFCKKYNSLSYKNAFQLYQDYRQAKLHILKVKDRICTELLSSTGIQFY